MPSTRPFFFGQPDRVYRVITDQLGSPVFVVNIAQPSDVWLDATFDAWGNVTNYKLDGVDQGTDTSGWPIPHGFAGGLFDSDTGLVRFGARDYDSKVGRWTSRDPILFEGGQANLYVYSHDSPTAFVDVDGEFPWLLIVGAALVVGADSALSAPDIAQMEGQAILGGGLALGELLGPLSRFAAFGREIKIGNDWRLAPFGNRTGHPEGRLPHYHRRGDGPGQGIGRHRP